MTWPFGPIHPTYSSRAMPTLVGTCSIGTMHRHAICSVKRTGCTPNRRLAHNRVDAVGANDDVRLDLRAIGKVCDRVAGSPGYAGAAHVETDALSRQMLAQNAVQIGAMRHHIGSAELIGKHTLHRHALAQTRVVPSKRYGIRRLGGQRPQCLEQAERAQHPHRIGTKLDACPDLAELGSALIDPHLETASAKRASRAKPTESRANNRYALSRHVEALSLAQSLAELLRKARWPIMPA